MTKYQNTIKENVSAQNPILLLPWLLLPTLVPARPRRLIWGRFPFFPGKSRFIPLKDSNFGKNTIERFIFRKLALKGCSAIAFYHSVNSTLTALEHKSIRPHLPLPSSNDTWAPLVIPNLQQAWPVDRGDGGKRKRLRARET